MNKRKKVGLYVVVFLLFTGLLTGCNKFAGEKEETEVTEEIAGQASEQEKKEGKKEIQEEGQEEKPRTDDKVLMTIGKEVVSLEEAQVYIFFLKKQYESSIGSVIWDYTLEEETIEEFAKEQIKSLLTQVKITKQAAEKLGITLSEDELDEARVYSREYLSEVTEEEMKKYNLSEEFLAQIYGENILANKVFDISTNDVDTNIPEEEVRQITIQYLMVMTKGTDKNGVAVDMNEEEKKKAKSKAKKLLKEAKSADNFLALAESNTDAKEVQLTFAKADAPEELKEISFQLESGQLSGLITEENGYYIVYCVNDNDEDATAAKREELIMERQRASFERKFTQWSADYEIVISAPLWDKIDF